MIRRKALFKVILIITALCLGTPSEAGKPCMWCDDKFSQPFMGCLTLRIANNPNFKSFAPSMEEMKNDLLNASKAMKSDGPIKETVMKGALAMTLVSLINANENPDAKLSYINFVLNQCYQNVNKSPDRDYIDELVKIIKDILKEKRNSPNVQQPEGETQSDEIPQAGQNISPSQENNYSPQQAATDPNQEQNQWNVLYGKTKQQGQNFQPNPSQGSANNFALRPLGIPYGTFQQPPGLTNNGYSGSANQNQPLNPLQTYNQGNPYAYRSANQKYFSNPGNSNPGASAAYRFYRYYEPQSNKRYIPSYAGSSASTAYYDPYNYSPNNPASSQKPSLTNIYKGKQKRKPTDSPQIKPDSYNEKSPGAWQLQNQKEQPNTNDNSDQSPDDKAISYDKLIKSKAYKKDDQSYVDDKTVYSGYDDNNQPPNYKHVNIKQKKGDQPSAKNTDSDDDYYDGSYDCDDDDYDRDGEDDSWNSNGEDSNINLRDDLGFSKEKQNPGTRLFQNQKKQPNTNDNSDQSPDDKAISYDKLIKNEAYKKDDQSYVDDKTYYSGYDDNNQPPNYKPVNIKQKKGDQSSSKSTDSDDDYYDGSYDCDDDDYDRDGEDDSWISNGEDSNINLRDDLGFSRKKQNPGTRLFQNQKKQPNTNDNSDQSPDDKAISYDKLIKNEAYKKDDQSYVDDKTYYSGYDDNNQPPNYKPVNIKQKKGDQSSSKSTDSNDDYYDGSYDCDDDDYDRDGEDDSWNSNGEDSNINLRDDLGFSKKKQNPGTRLLQNQKKQPNDNDKSDQSPNDKALSYDKLIKNKTYKKDDQSYVNDKTNYSAYDDKNQPPNYKSVNIKQKSTDTDDNYYEGSYEDDDYYDDGEDDSWNSNSGNRSKEPKRQKNKSPQYLSEFDKDESQEITTLPPYIDDDQQTSTPPDIDQKTSTSSDIDQQTSTSSDIDQQTSTLPDIDQKTTTAAIIQNTLKGNDKKKVLSADAPVLQPNISDNIQKLDFKKANHSESDDRVKILKKWALDCIKNGKFDYNIYSHVIVGSMKSVQQTHPDWNLQKSQTMVLIETIFALTQLLLESNIKEVKDIIQQPQKTVEPVKLPPNIQQSNQNAPQKNQNPNYQSGEANKNSQPAIQNKSSVDYSAPQKFIAYLPQNKKIQKNWGNNQNLLIQNTPRRQPDYVNTNPVPPQAIPIPPQSTSQDNSWKISDQNNFPATNNNPGFKQNGNQGRWNNAQSRITASSVSTQNAAQGNNWNTGNQKWQNKLPQRNGNNANFPQFGKQPSILGQVNTNQENLKWGDKTFSTLQTVNSNVRVPDINTLRHPLGYQDNWPGLQQNPSFSQNRVQGNWGPTPSGSNSPSLLRNGKPGFLAERGNGAFIPNGPSNPSFMQNGYQRGNQGIGRVSQTDNSPQKYQWNRK